DPVCTLDEDAAVPRRPIEESSQPLAIDVVWRFQDAALLHEERCGGLTGQCGQLGAGQVVAPYQLAQRHDAALSSRRRDIRLLIEFGERCGDGEWNALLHHGCVSRSCGAP